MSTGRGVTDVKIYTPSAVLERFGVTPAQIPDYIGLKGDSSDNIPGVPGRRREDGGTAAAAVRLHRPAVRAPGRGQVGQAARAAQGARAGSAPLAAARDHGPGRAARARPGRAGHHLRLPAPGRQARRRLRALRVQQPAPPPQGDLGAGGRPGGGPRRGRRRRRARAPGGRAGRRPRRGAAREGGGRARLRAARRRGRPRRRRRTRAATSVWSRRATPAAPPRSGCWPATSSRTTPSPCPAS